MLSSAAAVSATSLGVRLNGYLLLPDGHRVPVAHGLTIGRVDGCDLRLEDPKASRHHARLIVEASVVEIEDLGSSNGTRLNGKEIQRRMLRSGDVIQIGTSLIIYREEGVEAALTEVAAGEPVSASPPEMDVIEFVDERVEVPKTRSDRPVTRRQHQQRNLRKPSGGGILRDDLRQMGRTQRFAVVVLVLVVAAALGYVTLKLVSG